MAKKTALAEETEAVEATDGLTIAERVLHDTGFEIADGNKLERVIYGNMGRSGVLEGGIGIDKDSDTVLAFYDRIGGLIKKDGIKIKTGSFWDFSRNVKAPRKEPDVMFVFNIGGSNVEVRDPSKLSEAIQVLEQAEAKKQAEFVAKKAKSKFKQ